jgi:hypothetical protein
MALSDKEIIEKFKIKPSDKILDIGGSAKQHRGLKIDTLVDIVSPEESPYQKGKLLAKHFIRLDITKDKLPFTDKSFDFVLCTHTIEDLYNPFLAIDEMSRVGKRGYIATPSLGVDIVYSQYNLTDWLTGGRRIPGMAHHKWLFNSKNGVMQVIPKNYSLLSTAEFQVKGWRGEEEFEYCWAGKIKYRQIQDLNFHELIKHYRGWMKKNLDKIEKGRTLIFIDSPFNLFKELAKLVLHKGEGFKH